MCFPRRRGFAHWAALLRSLKEVKRKIRQIQHTIEGTYAVADDGTWWRILDPLVNNWVQMPDLPDASNSLFAESEEHKPVARLKVKS